MKRFLLWFVFVVSAVVKSYAQDPEFSQFHNNSLYLNPAFAGSDRQQRVFSNYRDQWPNIPNSFVTYSFGYDFSAPQLNSGFGVMVMVDKAGVVDLKSTQLNLQYAYKFRNEDVAFSLGLNFGLAQRSLDFNKLLFGDQLNFSNNTLPTADPALFDLRNVHYFDFSFGGLMYTKDYWFGVSLNHLNTSNRTLMNKEADLPIKYSVHGGFKIRVETALNTKTKTYFLPSFLYLSQAKFDQFTFGGQILYEPVIVGVFYRGIALRQNVADNMANDAIITSLGFQTKTFDVVYSYDLTISGLTPSASGGAHEVSLKYHFNKVFGRGKAKRKGGYIPCPAFTH